MTSAVEASRPVRILTVCSHNRTRSVMAAALLESKLNERLGAGVVLIRSSGFGPIDLPAIDDPEDDPPAPGEAHKALAD